eukprot:GFYU01001672.1.p1 GENE.GFYU01001672.1~~GFYU01001672.1.p1  ORF type:complete len:1316 (-),score=421.11 GFYU01001672.1:1289-5212(-)
MSNAEYMGTSHLAVKLSWALPAGYSNGLGGSSVAGFEMEYYPVECILYARGFQILCNETQGESTFQEFPATTQTHIFRPILGATNYYFKIRAFTSEANGARTYGEYSGTTNITTYYATEPDAPAKPTITDRTRSALRLDWTTADDFTNNGAPVLNYLIECKSAPGTLNPKLHHATIGGGSTSEAFSYGAITKLELNTKYQCRIYSTNAQGTSVYSLWLQSANTEDTSPVQVPLQPDPPYMVKSTQTDMLIKFELPADHGGFLIQEMELQYGKDAFTYTKLFDIEEKLELLYTALFAQSTYKFQVRARNAKGWSPMSPIGTGLTKQAIRPDPPGTLRLLDGTNAAFMFEWDPAPWNGTPLTKYEIGCAENVDDLIGSKNTYVSQDVTTVVQERIITRYYIQQLREAVIYHCRVRAHYDGGSVDGGFATFTAESAVGPPLMTLAPTNPNKVTSSSVAITVVAPANDGGDPVDSYSIRYQQVSDFECKSIQTVGLTTLKSSCTKVTVSNRPALSKTFAAADGPEYLISTLTPNTVYEFSVAAGNPQGVAPTYSAGIQVSTLETKPNPVGEPSLLDRTNSGLFITWDEPEASTGAITNYEIRCQTGNKLSLQSVSEKITTKLVVNGTAIERTSVRTEYPIAGLTTNTTYQCAVKAFNSAGSTDGVPSALGFRTLDTTSTPLMMVSPVHEASTLTSTTMDLKWLEPTATGGFGILGYKIRWRSQAGNTAATEYTEVVVSAASQTTLTNLHKGQTIEVSIAARNAAGTGLYSIPTFVNTLSDIPDAPLAVAASEINHSFLIVKFSLLSTTGSRIDNGRVANKWVLSYLLPGETRWNDVVWTTASDATTVVGAISGTVETEQHIVVVENVGTGVLATNFLYLLKGLTPYSKVKWKVMLSNVHGPSAWSPVSEFSTTGPIPKAVELQAGGTIGETNFDVFFFDPLDTGGVDLTGYTMCHKVTKPPVYIDQVVASLGSLAIGNSTTGGNVTLANDGFYCGSLALTDVTILSGRLRSLSSTQMCFSGKCTPLCQGVTLEWKLAAKNAQLEGVFTQPATVTLNVAKPKITVLNIQDTMMEVRVVRPSQCGQPLTSLLLSIIDKSQDISVKKIEGQLNTITWVPCPGGNTTDTCVTYTIDTLTELTVYKVRALYTNDLQNSGLWEEVEVKTTVTLDTAPPVYAQWGLRIENAFVETFDAEAFLQNLAKMLNISPNRMKLEKVESGSIILSVRILEATNDKPVEEVMLDLEDKVKKGVVQESTGFRITASNVQLKETNPTPPAPAPVPKTSASARHGPHMCLTFLVGVMQMLLLVVIAAY